jgi:hypothetical protein
MRGLPRQASEQYRGRNVAPAGPIKKMNDKDTITSGRFLISPIAKRLENGWYACSVSIRSCCDAHDRVLRPTRLSQDKLAAVRYAIAEGLKWIGHRNTVVQGAALAAL